MNKMQEVTDEILLNQVRNTVGFSESSNKDEFLKGAQIAISKTNEFHKGQIDQLRRNLAIALSGNKQYLTDLETLSNLIKKYS